MNRNFRMPLATLMLLLFLAGGVVGAQEEEESEEEKKNWTNKTELGFTSTAGNSETTNLSLANNYKRTWSKSQLYFDIAAIRNETTRVTVSNPGTGSLVITEETEVNAETYAAELGYRREITSRLFWYVNGRWYRNTPAGIENRYLAGAGIGYVLLSKKKHTLLGELGLTYTDETQTSDFSEDFTSGRLFFDYTFKISENTELSSDLEGLFDFDDSDNWQSNWITSLTTTLTAKLALKVSYTVVYDNQPAIVLIPPDPGAPVGSPSLPLAADKTDRFFTVSAVLNF